MEASHKALISADGQRDHNKTCKSVPFAVTMLGSLAGVQGRSFITGSSVWEFFYDIFLFSSLNPRYCCFSLRYG